MSKKNIADSIDKEEILRAILIVDDFEDVFKPFLSNQAPIFLPLVTRKILDYSLEWLTHSSVQEVILFCSSNADAVKQYITLSEWGKEGAWMKVFVMLSESCMSVGDALRDIDNKGIIKSDFILLSTSTVANFKLQDVLKVHKSHCKDDRGAAMTMIFQDRGCTHKGEETITAINAHTQRLLLYSKSGSENKIQLPMEIIGEHPHLNVHSTLQDTGVAICSPSVPLLFSDNFDFQSKDDFIRGLLLNEEVLASRIYCHVTPGYGQTVRDWSSYQRVSLDVMHRWTFPFVPDVKFGSDEPLVHNRNCIYKHSSVNLSRDCKLNSGVVIGKSCTFGNNVELSRCVVGSECVIGDNVKIQDSFIFDNVTIQEDCVIKFSVVGENVNIHAKSTINNCQLHHGVVFKTDTLSGESHAPKIITRKTDGNEGCVMDVLTSDVDSDEGDGSSPAAVWLVDPHQISDSDAVSDSGSEVDVSRTPSPEPDDCGLFYSEVVESLQRGYEERFPCSNLILEVNSSRYAYNVTLSEVTQLMCKAVLALPPRLGCPAKPLLTYFQPLFTNYIKSTAGQLECLSAFEEMHAGLGNELISCLHYLYDCDILEEDVILKWHDEIDDDSLRFKLKKFVVWLQEEGESEED